MTQNKTGIAKIQQRLADPRPLTDQERAQISSFLSTLSTDPVRVELVPEKFSAMKWVNIGCYVGIGLMIAPLFLAIIILGIPFAFALLNAVSS